MSLLNLPDLISLLETWFAANRRSFPWRETSDPYAIWVSEIMLQQTRTTAVLGYYTRFLNQFPTLQSLAEADEALLLKAWEGLGYYSRARNLQKGVQTVLERFHGQFPRSFSEARSIPGIGPYTAGAILSFAFDESVPAVDGNAVRVLSRLLEAPWALERSADRQAATRWVAQLLEKTEASAKRFNEGLIELGALLCLPKNPRCSSCPWKTLCLAQKHKSQTQYPLPKPKKPLPVQQRTVLLVESPSSQQTLVVQRPSRGLLAHMWEFPCLEQGLETESGLLDILEAIGFSAQAVQALPPVEHRFTHRIWQLWGYRVKTPDLNEFATQWNQLQQDKRQQEWLAISLSAPVCSWPLDQLESLPFGGGMEGYRQRLIDPSSWADRTSSQQ